MARTNLTNKQVSYPADKSNGAALTTKLAEHDTALDALEGNTDYKASVRFATTANINLSTTGLTAIDGVTPVAGNRALVKNQSTGSQNGIYVVGATAWTRATDCDASAEVTSGMQVFVSEGTANGGKWYMLTTADPITLATTSLVFTLMPASADLASTASGKGASLVGIEDSATAYTATTVEGALAEVKVLADAAAVAATLAATTTGDGASTVGIEDSATQYTATNVETALAEVKVIADAAAVAATLAATTTGDGAALIGIEDAGTKYTGTTVEAALSEAAVAATLAATTTGNGASLIGIEDSATQYTATNVETALAEVKVLADAAAVAATLASTATGDGAALIGIEDSATQYTATTVEAALAEVKVIADAAAVAATLASTSTGDGAALIGIEDSAGQITGTTVETALAEIVPKTIQSRTVRVQHTDLTVAVNGDPETEAIGAVLPANAVVLGHEVNIATLFSGGDATSVKIDIGGTNADAIVAQMDVFTGAATGALTGTPLGVHPYGKFSAEQLNIIFTPDVGHSLANLDAGDLTVTVWFFVIA